MKNPGTTLFPLLLLGLLAGLTFWLERMASLDDPDRRAKARHDPDAIIEHFNIQRYDAAGELQNSLTADKLVHFPDDDSTEVSHPSLTYHQGSRPTRIGASRAWLSRDGKEVRLIDAVRLVRQGAAGDPDTVLETARMTVFPEDETAHSVVPVTIRQGLSVVTGSGLEYQGKESLAVLKGRAHGIFYRTH